MDSRSARISPGGQLNGLQECANPTWRTVEWTPRVRESGREDSEWAPRAHESHLDDREHASRLHDSVLQVTEWASRPEDSSVRGPGRREHTDDCGR